MNNIAHVAINTFREAAREKVLYIILFFAICLVLASRAIGWISVGQQIQVVKHFSLAIISFFGALISIFLGTALIFKEIDKRTIYTILSKPVYRFEFLLGKFLGLLGILFCIVFSMGLLVSAYISVILDGTVDTLFLQAIILIFFELVVVTSLAIFFGTISSPVLSALFTFSAYLIGQVTPSLRELLTFSPLSKDGLNLSAVDELTKFVSVHHSFLAPLSRFLYAILPNLSHFALRNRVVYGPPLHEGEFMGAVLYSLSYCGAILMLSILFFSKRRF